jgi:undecaprenyl-diphosphatase
MIAAAMHPISYLQALILGLTQGIAEPFPISSLGHGVIIRGQAAAIGTAQAAALIPGISRSGVTMGGGLMVGLSNEDAARFGFLLATPVIAAAGLLKLPELFGSAGDGVRGPALVGALAAAFTTFFAVRFLLRFFQTNRLTPFGIYCLVAGIVCTLIFAF